MYGQCGLAGVVHPGEMENSGLDTWELGTAQIRPMNRVRMTTRYVQDSYQLSIATRTAHVDRVLMTYSPLRQSHKEHHVQPQHARPAQIPAQRSSNLIRLNRAEEGTNCVHHHRRREIRESSWKNDRRVCSRSRRVRMVCANSWNFVFARESG